jgi:hypothetical protein
VVRLHFPAQTPIRLYIKLFLLQLFGEFIHIYIIKNMSNLKKCNKCNLEKDEICFSKNKTKKDGLSALCKDCHKNYRRKHYLENKEKVLEQVKLYEKNKGEKNYLKKYETLKDIYPEITYNDVKSNRINAVSCFVCGRNYFKHKNFLKYKNICSNKCFGILNFNPFLFLFKFNC